MIRTYSELILLPTFEERFAYLYCGGLVGTATFGYQRWLNQKFYHSGEWMHFRNRIIIRDNGCDLGTEGYDILGEPIIIHHLNQITYDDILKRAPCVFDPNNVISTKLATHNAIHYGGKESPSNLPTVRSPNDTCPWRQK